MAGPGDIRVLCAGGGHRPFVFTTSRCLTVLDENGRTRYQGEVLAPDRSGPRGGLDLECATCGRTFRRNAAQWRAICSAWRAAGRDTLDIAALAPRDSR